MARPKCCRRVSQNPACRVFKPVGVPTSVLEEIVLSVDEFEALRLADLEGLYQEQAAERMNVSRQTFGRIVESARRKVAQVLSEGLALRIDGGEIETPGNRPFKCDDCQHTWWVPYGTCGPEACPECKSQSIHCLESQGGPSTLGEDCQRRQCRRRRRDTQL
jgi:uncharacterized protein